MTSRLFLAMALLVAPGFGLSLARADLVATVDENGNGTSVLTTNGQTGVFPGANGVDPFDPGNGLNPLVYDLGNVQNLVVGDLVINEVGNNTISDLIRFTTDPLTGHDLLIFYSDTDDNPKALADVGIPASRQTNLLTFTEQTRPDGATGLFDYFPTANQPGFVLLPRDLGKVGYNFISDTAAPEPCSMVLLGSGLGLLLLYRKRRRSSPSA